jgi:hypothetical protein
MRKEGGESSLKTGGWKENKLTGKAVIWWPNSQFHLKEKNDTII